MEGGSEATEDRTLPVLPCPDCRKRGHGGGTRIGNRRGTCSSCNNFNQRVVRLASKFLREKYPEEYAKLRLRAELDLYPQVIEEFIRKEEAQ